MIEIAFNIAAAVGALYYFGEPAAWGYLIGAICGAVQARMEQR